MVKISGYWQDVAERAARTFVQGYYGAWTVASLPALVPTYDKLFTVTNLQTGVVTAVASIAMSLGAKKFSNKNSASVLSGVSAPVKPVRRKRATK